MVSCNILGMFEPFYGSWFGHALSKVYQYVIIDEKVKVMWFNILP
jgi:hypothetical protein